ncbi:hypothetical protein TrVE_jg7813 [Triparma verrucosa]|uniref:F-box domain-containing protein n=1 Tax=Triparma verrucosa TaxID=1606542 RepID=A0A9W7B6Z5_9STRA|nr:hypothetical protein TrVE_jg7813 [Triparma verrucosa]
MTRTYASTTHQKIETGREDDGNQDEAGVAAVVNWTVPSFFFLDDWRFLFVENVPLDTLMTMQLLCTDWRRVVDTFIARKVESVFSHCFKLVPSHIDVADYDLGNEEEVEKVDVTWEVVEHLRSLQS